jgi:hypothetical protein
MEKRDINGVRRSGRQSDAVSDATCPWLRNGDVMQIVTLCKSASAEGYDVVAKLILSEPCFFWCIFVTKWGLGWRSG